VETRDYLRLARRYWRVIAACVAVAVALAWVTTPDPAPPGEPDRPVNSFQASHTLIRSSESIIGGAGVGANVSMKLLSLLATTGEVPLRVAEAMGEENPAVLMAGVEAVGDNELGTLRISAIDATNGERAAQLANTTADELVAYLAETAQTNQQQAIEQNGTLLQELEERIESLNARIPDVGNPVLEAQRGALVRQYGAVFERSEQLVSQPPAGAGLITLERATPIPVFGSGPAFEAPESRMGRLAAGLVAGLVAGAGIALVLSRFSTRLRSRDEVEEAFDLPVVAEVPPLQRGEERAREILAVTRPESGVAESYRSLRTAIEHMPSRVLSASLAEGERRISRAHRVVLVTSPGPGEGKTTTVANLAACFAEVGKTVAVVAADAHRPELMTLVLEAGTPADGTDAPAPGLVRTTIEGVWLLPTSELVGASGRRLARNRSLRDLLGGVDIVLVDTPPLLLSTEAADLAKECDTILLVARSRRTRTAEAHRVSELLGRLGATVLGVALIGAEETLMRAGEYYYAPIAPPANGTTHQLGNGVQQGNGAPPADSEVLTQQPWQPGGQRP
jgi:Mrp family chromosome partitioning ATPase